MADKKLTTAEILAKLRKQDAGEGGAEPAAEVPPVESSAAAEAEAAPPQAATPAAKPSSTADILAAARAQAAGGAAQPPATAGDSPKPAAKPTSTADILAAARANKGSAVPAPKAAGGKPTSTADILAAARAGKAAGGATSPKSATAKPAAKTAPKSAPAVGDRPSVAEMVKAAREGRPMEDESVKMPAPRLPSKPPVPKVKKSAEDSNRRGFLVAAITTLCTPYYLAWTILAAIGGIWSLATARFMMPNMIVEPPTKFKIGPPSDYPLGTVSTKWKAERGIWVVHTDGYDGTNLLYALASVCTHLGCTPNWLGGEQKFKCPCHGSGFYITGINFEGPAPRPLERVGIRVAEDGSLEVDKSVKFQEELGQWQDPASFVQLS